MNSFLRKERYDGNQEFISVMTLFVMYGLIFQVNLFKLANERDSDDA